MRKQRGSHEHAVAQIAPITCLCLQHLSGKANSKSKQVPRIGCNLLVWKQNPEGFLVSFHSTKRLGSLFLLCSARTQELGEKHCAKC